MGIQRTAIELNSAEQEFLAHPHSVKGLWGQARTAWTEERDLSETRREDRWAVLAKRTIPKARGADRPFGAEIVFALRKHLANLQGSRCCYCRRWLQNVAHARPVEHVLSRDDYPQFSLHYWNLALACRDCNHVKTNKKWTSLPVTAAEYPINADDYFHPRIHIFDAHIRYVRVETNDASIAIYQGITEQGRQLCREHLKKISQVDALFRNNRQISSAIERLQAVGDVPNQEATTKLGEFVDALHTAIYRIAGL